MPTETLKWVHLHKLAHKKPRCLAKNVTSAVILFNVDKMVSSRTCHTSDRAGSYSWVKVLHKHWAACGKLSNNTGPGGSLFKTTMGGYFPCFRKFVPA